MSSIRLSDLPPYYQEIARKLLEKKGVSSAGRPRHTSGVMNKTEARYAREVLDPAVASGTFRSYLFESLKLRLADKTWFTPDFASIRSDGGIVFHEVKGGHWEDDARVKIKCAAEMYPDFEFLSASYRGGWNIETYTSRTAKMRKRELEVSNDEPIRSHS